MPIGGSTVGKKSKAKVGKLTWAVYYKREHSRVWAGEKKRQLAAGKSLEDT